MPIFTRRNKCSKGIIIMNCNDIIKRLRAQNLYTQEFVANELNICQRTYCDYELGYTRIPIESLIKLAKLYNVDMNYITGVSRILNCYPKE